MKTVLANLKPYKKWLIIGPIFKLIEAIIEVQIPIIIAEIIDNMDYYNITDIINKGLFMLFLIIIGLISAICCQFIAAKTAQGYSKDLREKLFNHILKLSNNQVQRFGSSALSNRITYDISQLEIATSMFIRLVIRVPFICISSLVMTFIINTQIGFIMLFSTILFSISIYIITKISTPLYNKSNSFLDKLLLHVKENLINVRLVRSFAGKRKEREKFKNLNFKTELHLLQANFISSLLNPITSIILNITIVVVLYSGKSKITLNLLTKGELIAVINYLSQMLLAIIVLSNLIVIYTKAFVSAKRVNEVLEVQPEMISGNIYAFPKTKNIIEFKNVTFLSNNFSKEKILDNINIKISQGEIIGIIGLTGSGKSTLLNLINRSYDITTGELILYENDIKSYDLKFLKQNVQLISGKANFFKDSIKENVALSNDISDEEIKTALEKSDALEFVQKLNRRNRVYSR